MISIWHTSSQHKNPSSFDLLREHVTILWKRISWKRDHGSIGRRADAGSSLDSLLDFVISTVYFGLNQFFLLVSVIVLHINHWLKDRVEKRNVTSLEKKRKQEVDYNIKLLYVYASLFLTIGTTVFDQSTRTSIRLVRRRPHVKRLRGSSRRKKRPPSRSRNSITAHL